MTDPRNLDPKLLSEIAEKLKKTLSFQQTLSRINEIVAEEPAGVIVGSQEVLDQAIDEMEEDEENDDDEDEDEEKHPPESR